MKTIKFTKVINTISMLITKCMKNGKQSKISHKYRWNVLVKMLCFGS